MKIFFGNCANTRQARYLTFSFSSEEDTLVDLFLLEDVPFKEPFFKQAFHC